MHHLCARLDSKAAAVEQLGTKYPLLTSGLRLMPGTLAGKQLLPAASYHPDRSLQRLVCEGPPRTQGICSSPGCSPQRGRCRGWCRRAGRSSETSRTRCPAQRKRHLRAGGWTSPGRREATAVSRGSAGTAARGSHQERAQVSSPPEPSASQKGHGAAHQRIRCFLRGSEWSRPRLAQPSGRRLWPAVLPPSKGGTLGAPRAAG